VITKRLVREKDPGHNRQGWWGWKLVPLLKSYSFSVKVVCYVSKTRKAVTWVEIFVEWDSAEIAGDRPADVVAADVGTA
jgi:hypothetical protein